MHAAGRGAPNFFCGSSYEELHNLSETGPWGKAYAQADQISHWLRRKTTNIDNKKRDSNNVGCWSRGKSEIVFINMFYPYPSTPLYPHMETGMYTPCRILGQQ